MQLKGIKAAAAYAGCSGRFVEKLLAQGGDYIVPKAGGGYHKFKIRRGSGGHIDADQLRALVAAKRQNPYRPPGRMIGTCFPQKNRRRSVNSLMSDEWRLNRALTLIGKINSLDYLKSIATASFQRAKALGLKIP